MLNQKPVITNSANHVQVGVAPFENLSEKEGFDHFVRGFTDDLVTDLSRFAGLRIVLKTESLSQSPCEYMIKGSFRTYSDKVRINVQLLKTEDGSIIFAGRHDKDFDELFDIQDEMSQQLVNVLQTQINNYLVAITHKKSQTKIAAYDYWLRGMEALKPGSLETDLQARELFNKALEIDPDYARAYTGLSLSYFNEWSCQLWSRWEVSKTGAGEFAQKAIALDESEYEAHAVMGRVHLYNADYEQAERCLRRSLLLNPNDADNLVYIASCFTFMGQTQEAEEIYSKAILLNPYPPDWYHTYGALIYFENGKFEEALNTGEQIKIDAFWVDFPAYMAAIHLQLNQTEKMHHAWRVYLELFDAKIACEKHSSETEALHWFMNVNPYRDKTNLKAFWSYMKKEHGLETSKLSAKPDYPLPAQNSFIREGDLWQVCYAGHSVTLRHAKGLTDIAALLNQAGKEVHCSELMGAAVAHAEGVAVLDRQAKHEYEQKITDLREELEEAELMNNLERASQLNAEYEQLIEHLSNSLGLAGKTRKTGSSVEKARAAVTLRIRGTIKKIASVHEALAQHLSHSIKTGTLCSYQPEKPVDWLV